MKPQDALRNLHRLVQIGRQIEAIAQSPELDPVDVALLQHLVGSATLLAGRMEAKALGANMVQTLENLHSTAHNLHEQAAQGRVQ